MTLRVGRRASHQNREIYAELLHEKMPHVEEVIARKLFEAEQKLRRKEVEFKKKASSKQSVGEESVMLHTNQLNVLGEIKKTIVELKELTERMVLPLTHRLVRLVCAKDGAEREIALRDVCRSFTMELVKRYIFSSATLLVRFCFSC